MSVFYTNNHRLLTKRSERKPLTDDPKKQFLDPYGHKLDKARNQMICSAIEAMERFKGVNFVISLNPEKQHPKLSLVHRTWGICLDKDGDPLMFFTHDSRADNVPFSDIAFWPEVFPLDHYPSKKEFAQFDAEWGTPQKWFDFFLGRLHQEVDKKTSEQARLKNLLIEKDGQISILNRVIDENL